MTARRRHGATACHRATSWNGIPTSFDLGVDSLDFWNILMDVEDRAGAEVPGEVLDRPAQFDSQVTVGDLLDAMGSWEPTGGPGPP